MAKYEDIGDKGEVETTVSTEAGTETERETVDQELKEKQQEEKALEITRAKVRDILFESAYDGRLENAFAQAKEEKLEKARTEVKDALVNAACGGKLEHAMMHVKQMREEEKIDNLRQKAGALLQQSVLNGNLAQALTEAKVNRLGEVHKTAWKVFAEDVQNGSLDKALADKKQLENSDDDVMEVRKDVGTALVDAMKNGNLEKALKEMHKKGAAQGFMETVSGNRLEGAFTSASAQAQQQEKTSHPDFVENMRFRCKELLSNAAVSGSLEGVLKEASAEPPAPSAQFDIKADSCRAKARDFLLRTLHNGQLEKTLQSQAPPGATGLEAARLKARELLKSAATAGNLEQVFTEIRTARQAVRSADLKKTLSNILSNAALDGRLQSALMEVKQKRKNAGVEEVRIKAREILIEGALSGRLQAACLKVQQEHKQEQVEDVRANARRTLIAAAESGALKEKCLQVKQDFENVKRTEDIRVSAKNILTSCLLSGRLEAAVMEVKKAKEESQTEDLRPKFQESLVDSVFNGRLEKVRREVRKESEEEQEDHVEQQGNAAVYLDEARLQFRDIFSKAATDGKLHLAFQNMVKLRESKELSLTVAPKHEPETHEEGLRFKMCNVLFDAAESGKLQNLLETMGEPAPETMEEPAPSLAPAPVAEEAPVASMTMRVPTLASLPGEERMQLEVEDKEIELIDEDTKALVPMKPQIAKGTVRPSRFTSRKYKEVVPPLQRDEVQEGKSAMLPLLAGTSRSRLSSSLRSKRRIFGSVTRAQSEAEEDKPVETDFMAVSRTTSRHSIRRLQAEVPGGLSKLSSPPQQRPSSTRMATEAASAMAMDLGLEAETSAVPKAPRSFSQSAKSQRFSTESVAPTSSFLPSLSSKQIPRQSLAPSFALGADISKWDLSHAVF